MEEEITICGKCGKQIPKTQFCIYCGYNLLKDRGKFPQFQEEPEAFEPPEPEPRDEPEETFFPGTLAEGTMPPYPVSTMMATEETRVEEAWRELVKYQKWRVKLLDIFREQGMPTRVFTKIWEGYREEVSSLRGKIDESLDSLKSSYREKKAELEDSEIKLDELRVRVAIGEITESDLLIRTPSIRANVDALRSEVARLEKQIREKEASRPKGAPKEMFEFEKSTGAFIAGIPAFVSKGKLSMEHGNRLRTELEELRAFFSSLMGDPGERELMNELETIDVRYKVGEITLAEMESLKRDIVAKLERQWTD